MSREAVHLRKATELMRRVDRIERHIVIPGGKLDRLARSLRAEAARELQHVRGYTRRDTAPWPPEQMNLEVDGGMTR